MSEAYNVSASISAGDGSGLWYRLRPPTTFEVSPMEKVDAGVKKGGVSRLPRTVVLR